MNLNDKVAIVTGASSGIGAATTKALLSLGMKVVGFARRKEKIENLVENHNGKLFAVNVDVTKPQDILDGFDWVTKNVGPVYVLINNAGISCSTSVVTGNYEEWKQIMDTNFMGTAIASKEAIKVMNENQIAGFIININSILGYYDLYDPYLVMYRASKTALTAMTENIRLELAKMGSKIKVTNLAPGLIKTDIFKTGYGNDIDKSIFELPFLPSEDVADMIVLILSTPQRVNISEMVMRPVGEGVKNFILK